MLQNKLNNIDKSLSSAIDWNDYLPGYSRRELWQELDGEVLERLIGNGDTTLRESWPELPLSLYLDFSRTGNRAPFELPYFRRRALLIRLVQAYCAGSDTPEMLDGIIDSLDGICGEFSWVVPAHNWPHSNNLPPAEADTVDLFAANTASLLAMTLHLLKEPLVEAVPRLVEKVERECIDRCIKPYMENDWNWYMGFHKLEGFGPLNNWNPWITSNFLHTLFLISSDQYPVEEGVKRAVVILNNYLAVLSPDGGCNEGPAYWNHAVGSLFDCLDILEFASEGAASLFSDPWLKKTASYLERMHIDGDYFINFADCSGRLDELPFGLIGRIGDIVGNESMKALSRSVGKKNWDNHSNKDIHVEAFSSFRLVRDLFFTPRSEEISESEKPERDSFEDLQIAIFRDKSSGLTMACKGGHNDESHNHNDIGQFVIYGDGLPLLIDPGVGDYKRETFNHMRYTIWTMQSQWHNLPRINGFDQKEGETFRSDDFQIDGDRVSIGLAGAYPREAGVSSCVRSLYFNRDKSSVELTDTCCFENPNNDIRWHFLFLSEPEVDPSKGELSVNSGVGSLVLSWPSDRFSLELEQQIIPEDDHKMGVWGTEAIWRVKICNKVPLAQEATGEFSLSYRRRQ